LFFFKKSAIGATTASLKKFSRFGTIAAAGSLAHRIVAMPMTPDSARTS